MMKKLIVLSIVGAMLAGCNSGGGAVDVTNVEKQKEAQQKINNEQKKNLPPGEGPAG